MTNDPQAPSEILDELQRELDEIDRALEDGNLEPTNPATEDELMIAGVLARQGRFSEVSGEIADDLLSDDDTLDPALRERLTAVADRALAERRTLTGPLEGLLVHHRKELDLSAQEMITEIEQMLADDAPDFSVPDVGVFAEVETSRRRFEELAPDKDHSIEVLAAWIDVVHLDHSQAVVALSRSLPELASAGFGSSSTKRRTKAAAFVKALADRLEVEHP